MTLTPTYAQWGILNRARQYDRSLWDAVPRARRFMIRDAAANEWRLHYKDVSTLSDFLDYADWLMLTNHGTLWAHGGNLTTTRRDYSPKDLKITVRIAAQTHGLCEWKVLEEMTA